MGHVQVESDAMTPNPTDVAAEAREIMKALWSGYLPKDYETSPLEQRIAAALATKDQQIQDLFQTIKALNQGHMKDEATITAQVAKWTATAEKHRLEVEALTKEKQQLDILYNEQCLFGADRIQEVHRYKAALERIAGSNAIEKLDGENAEEAVIRWIFKLRDIAKAALSSTPPDAERKK